MMEIKKKLIKNNTSSANFVFFMVSIVFAFSFFLATSYGDDLTVVGDGVTLIETWKQTPMDWLTWSSRFIINVIARSLLILPKWVWVFYMMASMYALLKALDLLFQSSNREIMSWYIVFIVMCMPWLQLSTAGWVVTTATYFGPLAFGVLGLVPIAKVSRGERIPLWEFILYAVGLIYGTNAEQMMVVAFGAYSVATIYFVIKRKNSPYIWIMLMLSIVAVLNVMICPGNTSRSIREMGRWFPEYPMLDVIDKIDIGLFTTVKHMVLDNSFLYLIITCVIIAGVVWKKYTTTAIRVFGSLPAVIIVLFGPLKSFLLTVFPGIEFLYKEIATLGLFSVAELGELQIIQYVFFVSFVLLLIMAILLVSDNIEQFLTSIVILGGGLAARVAMGFSPTVYASSSRTFEIFHLSIVIVSVQIVAQHLNLFHIDKKAEQTVKPVLVLGTIVSMIYLYTLLIAKFNLF